MDVATPSRPLARRVALALSLAALVLLALAARLAPWDQVMTSDGATLFGTDAHYHLRRVRATVRDFPAVPTFDAHQNLPDGSRIQWPPAFDLTLAAAAWAAGGGNPSPALVEHVAAVAVPALGALLVLLAWAVARRLVGPWWGLLAGAWVALWPGGVHYAIVGRADHHVAEPLVTFSALWIWLRAGDAVRRRPALVQATLAGALMASSLLVWPSSLLALGALCAVTLAEAVLLPASGGGGASPAARAATTLGVAAALALPIGLLSPHGRGGELGYHATSALHPLLLGAAWVGIASAAAAAGRLHAAGRGVGPRLAAGALGPTLALGLTALIVPSLASTLGGGLGFVGREGFVGAIAESSGLFDQTFERIIKTWSLAFFLLPIAWVLLLHDAARRPGPERRARLAALVMLTAFGALAVLQRRFLVLAALPAGVALAALLAATWRRLPGGRGARWAVTLGAVTLCLPSAGYYTGLRVRPVDRAAIHEALAWMRDHTPPAGDVEDLNAPPPWGVLGPWNLGHEILYLGRRPNVANPFVTPEHLPGIRRAYRVLLEPDLARAAALARATRARYVLVVPDGRDNIARYARTLGLDDRPLFAPDGRATDAMRRTLWARLATAGPADRSGEAAGGQGAETTVGPFHLVHETGRRATFLGKSVPLARLWELRPWEPPR
ncbi:MAG: STT3 domain-containing protein [Myxococcota bacterium]